MRGGANIFIIIGEYLLSLVDSWAIGHVNVILPLIHTLN